LQVAAEFASCCALQVSEAALVKTKGLADEALRLDRSAARSHYLGLKVPKMKPETGCIVFVVREKLYTIFSSRGSTTWFCVACQLPSLCLLDLDYSTPLHARSCDKISPCVRIQQ
jgi:hypothetical protein